MKALKNSQIVKIEIKNVLEAILFHFLARTNYNKQMCYNYVKIMYKMIKVIS